MELPQYGDFDEDRLEALVRAAVMAALILAAPCADHDDAALPRTPAEPGVGCAGGADGVASAMGVLIRHGCNEFFPKLGNTFQKLAATLGWTGVHSAQWVRPAG